MRSGIMLLDDATIGTPWRARRFCGTWGAGGPSSVEARQDRAWGHASPRFSQGARRRAAG
jgi:hypothetical protein